MESGTGTPLINSTSRRDIITNSPNILSKNTSSTNTNNNVSSPLFDDVTLSNLTITAGKLKDLEAEIANEAVELGTLKDAITKSEQLTYRISRILTAYETRMTSLERIVMPVYRNILNMSQINDRIEGTIGLVEHLMKVNEQVRKEVVILLPGPMIDNLLVYLDSIERLEAINQELTLSELGGHCKMSLERTNAALQDARSKLQLAFKNWLIESYQTTKKTSSEEEDETISTALKTIINFSMNSPTQFSALIADWIDIRSNYLASSCESLFAQAQAFEKDPSGYRQGSHSLPAAFSNALSLLHSEEIFISKVWPVTAIGPTFLRSAQILRDLALSTVESITGRMKKALARREYADQMFLFNVLGASYPSESSDISPDSLAKQVLLPSLKYFATCTATILTDLIGEIRGTIPRALERPFTVPQNATVYELTSISVNVLKRTEKDDRVIEAILQGQSTDNWDGGLVFPLESSDNADLPHLKRYITDVLGSLESTIDVKSKTLRRPMQTLLFQLNNYNYLAKGIGQMKMIDSAVLKRYEQIIEALKRSFINSWTMISALITSESSKNLSTGSVSASTPSSAKSSPKDRLKAFTLEFDEAVKVQQACAVPDLDLRNELKGCVKDTIMSGYIIFYNQNQVLFTSSSSNSSKYHDPDTIEDLISHLFEG